MNDTEEAEFAVYGGAFDGHEGIHTMFRAAPNGCTCSAVGGAG
jgi:hypothetical protein